MHRSTTAVFGIVAASLLVTACSSSGTSDKAAVSTTPPSTPATTTTVVATTPASAPSRYRLGQAWHWTSDANATGSTTVLAYRQPVLSADPPGPSLGLPTGSQWGRLDIKVCQTAGPAIGVSQDPWHLQFADGTQADTTGESGGDIPKPEFPQDGTVQPGSCVRGGIIIPVPKGQRPTTVMYAPESAPAPVYWSLPAT